MDAVSVFDSFTEAQVGPEHGLSAVALSSAVKSGPARKLSVPANTTSSAVDRAVGVMVEETSPETLIGDLAFEQVTAGTGRGSRGPRLFIT